MRREVYLLLFAVVFCLLQADATTWNVGPTRTYTFPSQVSTLVQDGDTVLIDAGVYNSDVARWSASNLVLRGNGGMAHMKSNGSSYGGKAIWVIAGTNTTVEWIEFSLCSVVDMNGAGIRQEGANLTVRHCYFHDNEDGILAGDNASSNILIEYSEFYNNGYGDGYSHNLYINHVAGLTFQYNYSHHAHVGHELKSRANTNYIFYNRIANETGDASREIDLPNGGIAIIMGNEIEQGVNSQNSNIVGYGLEGLTNLTAHELYFVNNTVVNDRSTGTFVSIQNGTTLYKSYNNLLAGTGTVLSGTAQVYDTSHNIHCSIAAAGFVNAAAFDYHLISSSPAINVGANAGSAYSYSLTPVWEYWHPASNVLRNTGGQLDVGAHEYQIGAGIFSFDEMDASLIVYPNPAQDNFSVSINKDAEFDAKELNIYNVTGRCVCTHAIVNHTSCFVHPNFPSGIYFVTVSDCGRSMTKKLLIQ
jgi:hypothetical protein